MALVQCLFVGNLGAVEGGALAICSTGTPTIRNCTFVSNRAGIGSAVYAEGFMSMENSIVAFNGPGAGVEVLVYPELTCCDIYDNSGGDYVGAIADYLGVDGNISEDPHFCSVSGGNFALRLTSPCSPANNQECGLIGAGPVGCNLAAIAQGTDRETGFELLSCAPNPFSHETRISFTAGQMIEEDRIRLQILDPAGRLVRTLSADPAGAATGHFTWDGRNSAGKHVARGTYLYRLTIGQQSRVGRVLFVR